MVLMMWPKVVVAVILWLMKEKILLQTLLWLFFDIEESLIETELKLEKQNGGYYEIQIGKGIYEEAWLVGERRRERWFFFSPLGFNKYFTNMSINWFTLIIQCEGNKFSLRLLSRPTYEHKYSDCNDRCNNNTTNDDENGIACSYWKCVFVLVCSGSIR